MMDFFWEQVKKRERIIRYVISGGTATGVNLLTLYLLTDWFGLWYLASAVLAFIGGFFTSFFLQKTWTFQDKRRAETRQQLAGFFLLTLFNLGLNTLLMYFSVDVLKIWYMLAQAIVSLLIAFWTYNALRFFIFKPIKAINE